MKKVFFTSIFFFSKMAMNIVEIHSARECSCFSFFCSSVKMFFIAFLEIALISNKYGNLTKIKAKIQISMKTSMSRNSVFKI